MRPGLGHSGEAGERQASLGKDQEVQLAEAPVPLGHQIQDRPHPGLLLGRLGNRVALLPAPQVVGVWARRQCGGCPMGRLRFRGASRISGISGHGAAGERRRFPATP